MKRQAVCSAVCLIMCLTAAAAFAQGANPCEEDVKRFCSHLRPGKGVIADCLKQNEDKLSPECKAQHLAEAAEVLRQTDQACKEDIVAFCGSYRQQSGLPLLECLKLNAPSLSPECRKRLFEALEIMHY